MAVDFLALKINNNLLVVVVYLPHRRHKQHQLQVEVCLASLSNSRRVAYLGNQLEHQTSTYKSVVQVVCLEVNQPLRLADFSEAKINSSLPLVPDFSDSLNLNSNQLVEICLVCQLNNRPKVDFLVTINLKVVVCLDKSHKLLADCLASSLPLAVGVFSIPQHSNPLEDFLDSSLRAVVSFLHRHPSSSRLVSSSNFKTQLHLLPMLSCTM